MEEGREDGEGAEYKDDDDAVSSSSCRPAVEKSEEGEERVRRVWGLLTVQVDNVSCRVVAIV